MARKTKAAAKPKSLVPGQQTLFSALGVKPPSAGVKRPRSPDPSGCEGHAPGEVQEELRRRTSLGSGAENSEPVSNQPSQLLSRRSSGSQAAQQRKIADVLLVMDFEATCDRHSQIQPQELIEFSCCILNTATMVIEAEFQQYVQPTEVSLSDLPGP